MTAGHAVDFAVRQEEDTISPRRLVDVGVASIAVGAAGVFVAGALLVASTGSLQPNFAGAHGRPRAAQRVLSRIEQTPIEGARPGIDLRDGQRRDLESWGWVDRRAGIAKIPIDRAMDIVAREGAR
jgi:hypothetical protein